MLVSTVRHARYVSVPFGALFVWSIWVDLLSNVGRLLRAVLKFPTFHVPPLTRLAGLVILLVMCLPFSRFSLLWFLVASLFAFGCCVFASWECLYPGFYIPPRVFFACCARRVVLPVSSLSCRPATFARGSFLLGGSGLRRLFFFCAWSSLSYFLRAGRSRVGLFSWVFVCCLFCRGFFPLFFCLGVLVVRLCRGSFCLLLLCFLWLGLPPGPRRPAVGCFFVVSFIFVFFLALLWCRLFLVFFCCLACFSLVFFFCFSWFVPSRPPPLLSFMRNLYTRNPLPILLSLLL